MLRRKLARNPSSDMTVPQWRREVMWRKEEEHLTTRFNVRTCWRFAGGK